MLLASILALGHLAAHVDVETVQVTVPAGEVLLTGTLFVPDSDVDHPGLIIAPNAFQSESTPMGKYLEWARHFAELGFEVLVYNRRGVNGSTGDAEELRWSELAADTIATTRWMIERASVRDDKVGLLGFSNSGWTVMEAAASSDDVAFVAVSGTTPVEPWKVDVNRVRVNLTGDGFSSEIVESAVEFEEMRAEVGRTGEGWDALMSKLEVLRGSVASVFLDVPHSIEDLTMLYRDHIGYDPLPVWSKVKQPVLNVFGEHCWDYTHPETMPNLMQAIEESGNEHWAIVVIPGANHSLFQAPHGGTRFFGANRPIAPGVLDVFSGWLMLQSAV